MFTIYAREVGGRYFDRYFKKWDNAKASLLEDLADLKEKGWQVETNMDSFNAEKGLYNYGIKGKTPEGERFSLALVDGYFSD